LVNRSLQTGSEGKSFYADFIGITEDFTQFITYPIITDVMDGGVLKNGL
jgi:hypothetical protein